MDAICGILIRRRHSKRRSSVTFVDRAVGLSRSWGRIDCLTERFGLSDCRGILIRGRGSRHQAWTLRPGSWRLVACDERGML